MVRYKSERPVADRHVLVVGATSGVGLAIARRLLEMNVDVSVLSRKTIDEVTNIFNRTFSPTKVITTDLADIAQTTREVGRWVNENRTVDVLVHCAVFYGLAGRKPFCEITLDEWDRLFAVNVRAQYLVASLILPQMISNHKGLVLGITSDVARVAGPGRIGYAATKAACYSLMVGLSEELRDTGISVVQLLPTNIIDTPGIRRRRPSDFDFSSYDSPDVVLDKSLTLISTLGLGYNGQQISVGSLTMPMRRDAGRAI